ncbi:MAG: type II secretion system protein GspD [Selenomonadaceae bacterium]|nr:type II secretion system protein GspD [Selenomonadaceae bacterium]
MKLKKFLPLLMSATFFLPAQIQAAPMTLSVHEADLRSTIMLVAKTGGLNVSIDDSVKGTISVSLSNVEPTKILEIITKTKNLQLIQDAGIFIVTANLKPAVLMQSYVIPIKYGDASVLRKAVFKVLDINPEENNSRVEKMEVVSKDKNTRTYYFSTSEDKDEDDPRSKRVYINPEVNALILFGTPAEYERVKNLLATLDVELKQVSVEAKFLIVNKEESKNLGIEWFWSSLPQYPERTISYEPIENIYGDVIGYREVETISRRYSNDTGYGIIQFGRGPSGNPFEFYYGAQINALVTDGKAKILSRPNVMTVQGREAVIYVGNTVPVEKTERSELVTTSSYEYRDAGIKLKYTPRINADGTITAKLYTEVSTPIYDEKTGAYRFNVRTADTTVTVRDGKPMVIGGLIGAEEEKAVSKIPFLGDLPILGALFRNHRKSKSESELIIFLTAHVLNAGEVDSPFMRRDDDLSDKP